MKTPVIKLFHILNYKRDFRRVLATPEWSAEEIICEILYTSNLQREVDFTDLDRWRLAYHSRQLDFWFRLRTYQL